MRLVGLGGGDDHVYSWNPNDHCFDWKRPCFGGWKPQNKGQTGSRYIYRIQIASSSTNWHPLEMIHFKNQLRTLRGVCYMRVSLNGGTPKSSILIGFSIINHSFWGTTILETPIYKYRYTPKISYMDTVPNFFTLSREVISLAKPDGSGLRWAASLRTLGTEETDSLGCGKTWVT